MDSLPPEMRAHIMSFTNRVDKAFSCLVCRDWKDFLPPKGWVGTGDNTMRYVVKNRHMNQLRYLAEELKFTKYLAHHATRSGDMELIKYAYNLGAWKDKTIYGFPKTNVLEVMKFLLEEKKLHTSYNILADATIHDDVEIMEYIYTRSKFNKNDLYRAAESATRKNKTKVIRWFYDKFSNVIDEDIAFIAIEYDRLEAFIVHAELAEFHFDDDEYKHRLIKQALKEDALQCLKYIHSQPGNNDYAGNVRKQLPGGAKMETFIFLYLESYLSYEEIIDIAIEKANYFLLSWLRGEAEYNNCKIPSVPLWSERCMRSVRCRMELLQWLRGDREYGKCPWDKSVIASAMENKRMDILRWVRDKEIHDEVCPWAAISLKNYDEDIVKYLRDRDIHGDDVCPWDEDIKKLVSIFLKS